MRTNIAGGAGDSFDVSSDPLWMAADKVPGHFLSDYLATRGLGTPSDPVNA